MRRHILLGIGLLEIVLAAALIAVGCQMPRPSEIDPNFDRAGKVAQRTAGEVQLMRRQIDDLRRQNVPESARQLKNQMNSVASNLQDSTIDFATVEAMSKALEASATGLESWSDTLDANHYLPALANLTKAADYLDSLQPLTMEGATTSIGNSNRRSEHDILPCVFSRDSGSDIRTDRPALSLAASLKRKSTDQVDYQEEFAAFRDRFAKLETSLDNSVQQINLLASIRLPVVPPQGLAGGIEMRPLWPEGRRTAADLNEALVVVKSFNRQLGALALALPSVSTSFASRRGQAEQFARSIEIKPTAVHEASASLRNVRQGLERTLETWPVLVDTLHRSAAVLNGSHHQLESVLAQRTQFEQAVGNGRQMAQTAGNLLESSMTKFDTRLEEQQQSFGEVEQSLNEVSENLPAAKHTANQLLSTLRWMFWLVGGLIGLHGLFVICDSRFSNNSTPRS